MAHSGVGPGKMRVTVTLTESVVTRFRTICKETNLPPATLSRTIDDFLKEMVDVLETARSRGSFTIRDMFNLMGKQMELLQEEVTNVKSAPKNKGVAKRIKARS